MEKGLVLSNSTISFTLVKLLIFPLFIVRLESSRVEQLDLWNWHWGLGSNPGHDLGTGHNTSLSLI